MLEPAPSDTNVYLAGKISIEEISITVLISETNEIILGLNMWVDQHHPNMQYDNNKVR